jgi:hypothetical protein
VQLSDKEFALQHIERELRHLREKSEKQMVARGMNPDIMD